MALLHWVGLRGRRKVADDGLVQQAGAAPHGHRARGRASGKWGKRERTHPALTRQVREDSRDAMDGCSGYHSTASQRKELGVNGLVGEALGVLGTPEGARGR